MTGEPNSQRYRTRGYLPHLERDGAVYFVTFRLGDSLPRHILEQLAEQNRLLQLARASGRELLPVESVSLAKLRVKATEAQLDAGCGACVLRKPVAAQLVADAIEFWDGKRYRLFAWCVMPNHVHVVLQVIEGESLSQVIGGWKSFTTRKINPLLGRSGTLWQREYYDRILRDREEFNRAVAYVADNPVRAGLKTWQWVRVYGREP